MNTENTATKAALRSAELFGTDDEAAFKRQFVVQFLAAWTASNFNGYCARGMQESLCRPPVEDAVFLANAAWKQWAMIH
jgi:hypothetical protein